MTTATSARGGTLRIANGYGNVEVSGIPKGYAHVQGQRLQPLCRKLGIKFAPAVVGFSGSRRYGWKPVTDGVVVSARSAPKLLVEIEARERRNPPDKRKRAAESAAALRKRRAAEHEAKCETLGVLTKSRTAEWLRRGYVDDDHAALIAFKADFRHNFTDYDRLMDETRSLFGYVDDDERRRVRQDASEIHPRPESWLEYLGLYDFPHWEVAKALARTLRSPQQAHPVWFAEAVIAVRRAGLPLYALTYESISDAIETWRNDRLGGD